jgi:hypothetical protein
MQTGLLSLEVAEGIKTKYLSIKEIRQTNFTRNGDKPEGGIVPEPEGTIVVVDKDKVNEKP